MGKQVFVLPDCMEEALYAYPVLMHYLVGLYIMNRDYKNIVVVCPIVELHKAVQSSWKWIRMEKEIQQADLDEAELVHEFDANRAYKLTKAVQKSIAESYAIQLGVGLTRVLPPVFLEKYSEERGRVLVVDRGHYDRVLEGQEDWSEEMEKFLAFGVSQEIAIHRLPKEAEFEEMCAAVARCSVVVGVRSSGTLLGSCAGKLVMELTSSDWAHRNWTPKWESRGYRLMYGNLKEMKSEFIWERLRQLAETKSKKKEMEPVYAAV